MGFFFYAGKETVLVRQGQSLDSAQVEYSFPTDLWFCLLFILIFYFFGCGFYYVREKVYIRVQQ